MKSESSSAQHWDDVYGAKSPDEVSWFQRNPSVSLALIEANAVPSQGIVDVGAGASTLVDRLVDRGYSDITVVDISSKALDQVATRLGGKSDSVEFVTANVLTWRPSRHFALWHDRAVFHFLTNPSDQRRYVATCSSAVSPGGVIVLGVFAPDGPAQCSGLSVQRYDDEGLARVFGEQFSVSASQREEHVTPWGAVQPFTWLVLRREGS